MNDIKAYILSMMKFEIVPTKEEHAQGFWLALDSVAKERQYIAFLEAAPFEKFSVFFKNMLETKFPSYVAIVNGQVVGWCDILKIERPIYAHSGVLGMGVMDAYRGDGIGTALLHNTIDQARSQGLTRVELTVRANNTNAMALYEKFGFSVEGVKKNGARIDGVYEDIICMGLLL